LEGLAKENPGLFYAQLAYFVAIGNILWPFGIICGHFGIFFPILVFCTKDNLATLDPVFSPVLRRKALS
jgi:hypothetical protein